MASLIKKVKGGKPYYYIAVSKRVNGKPRIVQQTYLGSVERILKTFQQKTAPVPTEARAFDLGLPAALWQAVRDSGVREALDLVWSAPRQGPAHSHFLLLAAFRHVCDPSPQTNAADWYERTVLRRLWGFDPDCFSDQAFEDRFDSIDVAPLPRLGEPEASDELLAAQDHLLRAFHDRQLVGSKVLAYDLPNFHVWIASEDKPSALDRRDGSDQRGSELRQVGISYVLDAQHGLSLMHKIYPSEVADGRGLPETLERIAEGLDRVGIPRTAVTLCMDEGADALYHMQDLERSGLGWIAELPWDQVPRELRQRKLDELPQVGQTRFGVTSVAEYSSVQGRERRCVLRYSATDYAEQMEAVSGALAKALAELQRLAVELAEVNGGKPTEEIVRERVDEVLGGDHLPELVHYELTDRGSTWELGIQVDQTALQGLVEERFGRAVLITSREDWSVAEVVEAIERQRDAERVFQGLDDRKASWNSGGYWSDSRLKVRAFYCMLGVSLLHYLHRRAQAVLPGLTIEELRDELSQVRQLDLLYPRDRKGSQPRTATVRSNQSQSQKVLVEVLRIDQLFRIPGTQDVG